MTSEVQSYEKVKDAISNDVQSNILMVLKPEQLEHEEIAAMLKEKCLYHYSNGNLQETPLFFKGINPENLILYNNISAVLLYQGKLEASIKRSQQILDKSDIYEADMKVLDKAQNKIKLAHSLLNEHTLKFNITDPLAAINSISEHIDHDEANINERKIKPRVE